MSNELQSKAIQAATRFVERRGYEVLDEGWRPEGSKSQIDLVAQDEDAIVFIEVTANDSDEGGFGEGRTGRGELELLAAKWLGEHSPEGDVSVRFDSISMIVVSADRALLRHHINCFSEA